jgi:hypothetical protein
MVDKENNNQEGGTNSMNKKIEKDLDITGISTGNKVIKKMKI